MVRLKVYKISVPIVLVCLFATRGSAQNSTTAQGGGSFRVQCPASTPWHSASLLGYDPAATGGTYAGPKTVTESVGGASMPYVLNGGAIRCQEISGGDGYMTEADGNQTFVFSFGPLSGMNLIKNGQPGTQVASQFNTYYNSQALPSVCVPGEAPASCGGGDPTFDPSRLTSLDGAVADPASIMTIGVLNGNLPAPLAAFDEDDECFLTLSNVGMIMRPDLFEQHTVHFHGYPNASSFYDGVPDASLAINIGGSFTYYYLAPDAGTYFWHCHITPPEHLQIR